MKKVYNSCSTELSLITPPKNGEVIVIAGPTASGKTSLAIELALKFNGEVISADSRQVYRGLDIGSGKVTQNEMKGIPHHLIDILDLGQKYSVGRFQQDALSLIKQIEFRGRIPIICGGTGLYIESVVEGYDLGSKNKNSKKGYDNKFKVYLLDWPRSELRQRISDRVDQRMEQGMLEEVQNLISSGVDPKWLLSLGLEYRYLTEYIINHLTPSPSPAAEGGNSDLDEMIAKLKFKIYQFAKRQDTWFRRWDYAKKVKMS